MLDLGSGGGIDVILSAKRVGPTGRAYGLDMTDEMLALAQRNAAEAGIGNAIFLKGVIEAVPLPAESVDVVISNCVINLSVDKPAVLLEIGARAAARRPDRDQRRRRRGSARRRRAGRAGQLRRLHRRRPLARASTWRVSRRPASRTSASRSPTRSRTGCTARSSRRRSPFGSRRRARELPVVQRAGCC